MPFLLGVKLGRTAFEGVIVSTDNGMSWTVRPVARTRAYRNGGDPSVAVGAANTVYFGFVDADGHPRVT